jgi:hypothetical protein
VRKDLSVGFSFASLTELAALVAVEQILAQGAWAGHFVVSLRRWRGQEEAPHSVHFHLFGLDPHLPVLQKA